MKRRFLSAFLALCLCLGLLPGPALAVSRYKGRYTEEEAAARGLDLTFSAEVLDFGTAEYQEGKDLFPQTLSISVTNNGSEELRYRGWSIATDVPVEVVSKEGLTTTTVYQEAYVIPPGAWITYPVEAKWIMPGDTVTFTFKCNLDYVRSLKDRDISLMLDFPDSTPKLDEADIYHAIPVLVEVTAPDYGRDLVVDRDSLEFVQYDPDSEAPAPQTVTVTHTGATDQVYYVRVDCSFDFILAGGHQKKEYTQTSYFTYLSPGEQCTITITPPMRWYSSPKNYEGTLSIRGEIDSQSDNPGNKQDEELTVKLTTRSLIAGSYRINTSASANGTLTPSEPDEIGTNGLPVPFGGSQTFTATPDPGYMVAAFYVDGLDMGRINSYTFTDIADNHSVEVVFEPEDWPYWYSPTTSEIWSNYPYTGTTTAVVYGKNWPVYVYPVGTVFYAKSEMWATAEDKEYTLLAKEMAPYPGIPYELYRAYPSSPSVWLILQGDPPVSTDPADQPSSWAAEQVQQAIAAGLVPAALRGKYAQTATRAEFCALATALYETATGSPITQRATFSDTNDVNVEKMAALGVVNGVGNGRFDPNGPLTREQAATMLSRLAEAAGHPLAAGTASFADSAAIASWAAGAVGQVQAAGVMQGTGGGNFTPQGSYTREQSILTILRLYQLLK